MTTVTIPQILSITRANRIIEVKCFIHPARKKVIYVSEKILVNNPKIAQAVGVDKNQLYHQTEMYRTYDAREAQLVEASEVSFILWAVLKNTDKVCAKKRA